MARNWLFGDPKQALDFTPLRGTWAISGGRYRQAPIVTGWIGSSVANCNSKIQVIASMTRVDPGTTVFSNLVFKSTISYPSKAVSGYWIAYNKCRTNTSGVCTEDPADKPGQAVFWRLSGYSFETNSGGATLLCVKHSPVKVNGLNTVRVVSNGSSHRYYLNGKLVCSVSDATYATGSILAAAYIAAAGGHAYQLDQLRSIGLDTAAIAEASPSVIMDPAALAPQALPAGLTPGGSQPLRQVTVAR